MFSHRVVPYRDTSKQKPCSGAHLGELDKAITKTKNNVHGYKPLILSFHISGSSRLSPPNSGISETHRNLVCGYPPTTKSPPKMGSRSPTSDDAYLQRVEKAREQEAQAFTTKTSKTSTLARDTSLELALKTGRVAKEKRGNDEESSKLQRSNAVRDVARRR